MKAEITEAVRINTIPGVIGGRDVLCLNESAIDHLVGDLYKLFKKATTPKKDKDVENIIDGIILEMNNVWGSSYRLKTEANRKFIRARLKDGHSISEILLVISTLWRQWGNDPVMSRFLRPITIFSPSKFEGYLNQALRLRANDDNMIYVQDAYGSKRRITKVQFEKAESGFFKRLD